MSPVCARSSASTDSAPSPAELFGNIAGSRSGRVSRTARVAELADAPDLGSGAFGREGSSPFLRTSQLLSKPSPVETGWDAVPDVEQRSPTRVGVVRVVELMGPSSAVGGVVGLSG